MRGARTDWQLSTPAPGGPCVLQSRAQTRAMLAIPGVRPTPPLHPSPPLHRARSSLSYGVGVCMKRIGAEQSTNCPGGKPSRDRGRPAQARPRERRRPRSADFPAEANLHPVRRAESPAPSPHGDAPETHSIIEIRAPSPLPSLGARTTRARQDANLAVARRSRGRSGEWRGPATAASVRVSGRRAAMARALLVPRAAVAATPGSPARARPAAKCNLTEADCRLDVSPLLNSLFRRGTGGKFPVMQAANSLFRWGRGPQPADCMATCP